MEALLRLRHALVSRHEDILQAVNSDFGGRAREETLLLELFPVYDQIQHARRHLKSWMRKKRISGSWFLMPSSAYIHYQPLGVVGIIGTWNYPLLLTLGPLVDAMAAGNHIIVKPSEATPCTAEVIRSIIANSFSSDYVSCITGGPEVGAAFSALPFDHLFFTGSHGVGKLVMRAAASNLTKITLELGGKSPAIFHKDCLFKQAVERVIAAKLLNAGQTCVAPDYILLPINLEAAFESKAQQIVTTLYPQLVGNPDYTHVISERHFQRLDDLVKDAIRKGARVKSLSPSAKVTSDHGRAFPPTLIFGANDSMLIMREEIFGPILPIIPYRTLEEAINYVNERPPPLALYYFDENKKRAEEVLAKTISGGAVVNDCMYHLGQHNLPFGGVGQSGMGHYHGFDGFENFSKKRGVMIQRRWSATSIFRPPYTNRKKKMIDLLLKLALW